MPFRRGHRRQPAGPPPVATVAFYGPNASFATKVVVSLHRAGRHLEMRKWFSDTVDVRDHAGIAGEMEAFLRSHGKPREVVMTDGIIGCPHEEGVDYMEGASCPQCPFWKGRDRFTHEKTS